MRNSSNACFVIDVKRKWEAKREFRISCCGKRGEGPGGTAGGGSAVTSIHCFVSPS